MRLQSLLKLIFLVGALSFIPEFVMAQETYLMDAAGLQRAKTRILAGDKKLAPALEKLVEEADKALQAGPFSVMDKKRVPPSGDKHDYMSIAPYWWPDPTKPDGLPYIRKDGQTNPERTSDSTDNSAKAAMNLAVNSLSLAYYFTDKAVYAERAAKLLRVWFLDSATKMNPHLNYGQAIPGRVEGRDIGIIDTHTWPQMLDCVALLSTSEAWSEKDRSELKAWFREYLDWLLTSKHGKNEARQPNNHGTYYDVQVAYFALFTDQPEIAEKVLAEAKSRRIAAHIAPDGGQPHELARTRSLSYSTMNLTGLFDLAAMGERFNLDLWNFQTEDGRSLRRALDYLAPYADAERQWPHPQIVDVSRSTLLPLLCRGALAFNDQHYETLINKIPDSNFHRVHLTFSPPN